jgi:hypothetical protein
MSVMQFSPLVFVDVHPNNNQVILKFRTRQHAEENRKFLEQLYCGNPKSINVLWADRDGLPIAAHLSFNKKHANNANTVNSDGFTKESLENFFYEELKSNMTDEEKQNISSSSIKLTVDLPRERGLLQGYGTLTYETSFKGIEECQRICSKYSTLITSCGVMIKITPHKVC